MTDQDYQREQELRAQTRAKGAREAAAILADYYEQHGQPSRAALWRRDMRVHAHWKYPADLIIQNTQRRRQIAMWFFANVASQASVGRAFRTSASWTGALINAVEREICEAANTERHWPTMAATRRLQAAGALPKPFDRGAFELGDMPPENWPARRVEQPRYQIGKPRYQET